MSNETAIDMDTIAMLRDVMEDDFQVLIDTFLSDGESKLNDLNQQITVADAEAVRRTAHSLKGSCGNVGAVPLADVCQILESDAAAGKLDNADTLLTNIQHEFSRVKVALADL